MRSIEVREADYEQKWQNAMMRWQKRKDAYVIKLAKSFFAEIKNELLKNALRKTRTFTHLNNSERMLLARTKEYIGYSLDEEFPVFNKYLTVDDLRPFFEMHSDIAKLEEFIKDAEYKAKEPKLLTMDEPKWLKDKKPTPEELETQKKMLQITNGLLKKKRDKSKFAGIKT